MLFLLFPALVWGTEVFRDLPQILEVFQSGPPVKSMCGTSDKMLAHKCALDLCGPPNRRLSIDLNDSNFDHYVKPELLGQFSRVEKKLGEIINSRLKRAKSFARVLQNRLEKGPLKVDFSKWSDGIYDRYAREFFSQHVSFYSDLSRPIGKRLNYTINLPAKASKTLKVGVEAFIKEKKKQNESSLLRMMENDIRTGEEVKFALLQRWLKFDDMYRGEKRKNPSFAMGWKKSIEKMRERMEPKRVMGLSNSDLYSLVSYFEHVAGNVIKRQTGKNPYSSAVCTGQDCRKALQKIINNYDFNGAADVLALNDDQKKKMFRQAMSYCKSKYVSSILDDPNEGDVKKMYSEIKEKFLDNVFSHYSESSKKVFSSYLSNRLKVRGKKEDGWNFFNRVEQYHIQVRNEPAFAKKCVSDEDCIREVFFYRNDEGKIDPLKGFSPCRSRWSRIGGDYFVPKEDAVYLSSFSCNHQSRGKRVLAHELGHALSWVFYQKKLSDSSFKKYLETRECVTNFYKGKSEHPKKGIFIL